ncbi:MAG: exosome complex protein Rrp42 [Candidatus Micrarchaeia archaeon]
MGDESRGIITKEIRRSVLMASLKKGKRFDERAFDEYRKAEVTTGVINTAEGSALARIGRTQVLVGVKIGMATPFADRPDEGIFMTNSELLPLASPTFEPGPPSEQSIELARVVDRGIRSAEVIDTKKLFVEEGKVLSVFVDIYVLDHLGNLTDTAALAAIAALKTTNMPKVENGKIIYKESVGRLEIGALPVCASFIKVGNNWLVDPLLEEEDAAETSLTIATTEKHVCAVQKRQGFMSSAEFLSNVDIAFKRGKELRSLVADL